MWVISPAHTLEAASASLGRLSNTPNIVNTEQDTRSISSPADSALSSAGASVHLQHQHAAIGVYRSFLVFPVKG